MTKIELIRFARRALTGQRGRYWKAVALYIKEIVENAELKKGELNSLTADQLEKRLLKGAANWRRYSEGGCALVYCGDIAARFFDKERAAREIDKARRFDSQLLIRYQTDALQSAARAIRCGFESLRILDNAF